MSEYIQGKYPLILIVVHYVWANTWERSRSKGFCILLVVVSSTVLLKCGSVHLHRFSSIFQCLAFPLVLMLAVVLLL